MRPLKQTYYPFHPSKDLLLTPDSSDVDPVQRPSEFRDLTTDS